MQCSTIVSVLSHEVIVFYLVFEVMLLVIVSTISMHWYCTRNSYAVMMLVVYTLMGSGCMGVSLVMYYVLHGSLYSLHGIDALTHSVAANVCTGLLFIAFLTKIPAAPFHHWLIEAHVESTTEGSILLAGVYLKVGVLG